MRVTKKNYDNYKTIADCKYQKTFPYINSDAMDVICVRGVNIEGLHPAEYAPLCSQCVGRGCKNYESR